MSKLYFLRSQAFVDNNIPSKISAERHSRQKWTWTIRLMKWLYLAYLRVSVYVRAREELDVPVWYKVLHVIA